MGREMPAHAAMGINRESDYAWVRPAGTVERRINGQPEQLVKIPNASRLTRNIFEAQTDGRWLHTSAADGRQRSPAGRDRSGLFSRKAVRDELNQTLAEIMYPERATFTTTRIDGSEYARIFMNRRVRRTGAICPVRLAPFCVRAARSGSSRSRRTSIAERATRWHFPTLPLMRSAASSTTSARVSRSCRLKPMMISSRSATRFRS